MTTLLRVAEEKCELDGPFESLADAAPALDRLRAVASRAQPFEQRRLCFEANP